ncbi:MAG: hypothetical protein U0871_00270 [Gemmataceae bacterium]
MPLSVLRPKTVAAPAAALPAGVLTAAEALGKVGQTVTVQFPVRAGRTFPGKRILLNSERDFRSKDNFTVVLQGGALAGPFANASFEETFQNKTIRATGKVVLYKDAPQIQLEDPKGIEIVSGK